jgi:DNA-binding NtrC family response regulator
MQSGSPLTVVLCSHGALATHLLSWFTRRGYAVLPFAAMQNGSAPALLVIDDGAPDWRAVIRRARTLRSEVPVIFVAEHGSEALAVEALRAGVNDYVTAPLDDAALETAMNRVVRSRDAPTHAAVQDRVLVGGSSAIEHLRRQVHQLSRSTCNVLITGETGVGKELVARLIHASSARRQAPFIPINCAALPDSLIESELFGYERGSFTGAAAAYPGKMKLADGGTLFLDEVGEMSLLAQAKLLGALESRTIFRLGGRQEVPVDFRLLSATNQDLLTRTHQGLFRLDLYYRLKVVQLALPPLRERREDIPLLAMHALQSIADGAGQTLPLLSPETLACLRRYDWPGNVRELQNVIAAAAVVAGDATEVCPDHLPLEVRGSGSVNTVASAPLDEARRLAVALTESSGNKSAAARKLRCSRMTVYRKLARYHSQI